MDVVYILSKIFTYIFLPPGIFVVLFFSSVLLAKRYRVFLLFFALCFYLLSNTVVANYMLYPLEKPFRTSFKRYQNVDAVVVLGGGCMESSPNLPLSGGATKRALYALMIAKSQNLPLIFSGGGLTKEKSEANSFAQMAKEMKRYLGVDITFSKDFQKNRFVILNENRSLDTFQNAKFTKEIFKNTDIKKPVIYLVTSAYHMQRASRLYRYFGFEVIPCATDFKVDKLNNKIWDYLPSIDAFYNSYLALHEYAGLLSLKFRGV